MDQYSLSNKEIVLCSSVLLQETFKKHTKHKNSVPHRSHLLVSRNKATATKRKIKRQKSRTLKPLQRLEQNIV